MRKIRLIAMSFPSVSSTRCLPCCIFKVHTFTNNIMATGQTLKMRTTVALRNVESCNFRWYTSSKHITMFEKYAF